MQLNSFNGGALICPLFISQSLGPRAKCRSKHKGSSADVAAGGLWPSRDKTSGRWPPMWMEHVPKRVPERQTERNAFRKAKTKAQAHLRNSQNTEPFKLRAQDPGKSTKPKGFVCRIYGRARAPS